MNIFEWLEWVLDQVENGMWAVLRISVFVLLLTVIVALIKVVVMFLQGVK